MRLLEAIIDANHRALAGDSKAGLHVAEYAHELPLIALTCIDPRLNRLFPGALALPEDNFIWLRNAGNIIFGPMSTMMRSLALACAVKGGKEIAIIGHSDCLVRHIGQAELLQKLQALGVPREQLPEDLAEFFGTFINERENVLKSVGFVRQSPLIGPRVPVHGCMIDTASGRLEWVVNGYETLARAGRGEAALQMPELGAVLPEYARMGSFNLGEMKFPEQKIGDMATNFRTAAETIARCRRGQIGEALPGQPKPAPPPIAAPPPIPAPKKPAHTGSWAGRIKR